MLHYKFASNASDLRHQSTVGAQLLAIADSQQETANILPILGNCIKIKLQNKERAEKNTQLRTQICSAREIDVLIGIKMNEVVNIVQV